VCRRREPGARWTRARSTRAGSRGAHLVGRAVQEAEAAKGRALEDGTDAGEREAKDELARAHDLHNFRPLAQKGGLELERLGVVRVGLRAQPKVCKARVGGGRAPKGEVRGAIQAIAALVVLAAACVAPAGERRPAERRAHLVDAAPSAISSAAMSARFLKI
jgi:hypothetical protein